MNALMVPAGVIYVHSTAGLKSWKIRSILERSHRIKFLNFMKRLFVSSLEVLEVAVVAVAAVFIVRTFLVQPFLVSGVSMEPSFSHGDYLLVDEFSYYFRQPERGEVIVFKYPGDESVYYIKRVIGLPGEEVKVRGGEVTVFGKEHPL